MPVHHDRLYELYDFCARPMLLKLSHKLVCVPNKKLECKLKLNSLNLLLKSVAVQCSVSS